MGPVVGIDLGTTNTVVGVVSDGQAAALADENGEKLIPSVVSFHPNGSVLVGRGARERRLVDAKNTIYSIKRLIGRSWDTEEVRRARAAVPVRDARGPGPGRARGRARRDLHAAGDQRVRAAPGKERRGGSARPADRPRRDHRARELQRPAARRDQGRRPRRRAGGAAHPERADGRRAGLRLRQGPQRATRGLRLRRRHLRRHVARLVGQRVRGAGDGGQHLPRRRRHRIWPSPRRWPTRSWRSTATTRAPTRRRSSGCARPPRR